MDILISAALASRISDDVPNEIVYLPEGIHHIHPTVNGKPKAVTVRVPAEKGETIAAALNTALVKRQASNVRPWFDFEHKGGKASAIPQSFKYEAGKGIVACVEWTTSGRDAIQGKDFSYLSPTFLLDDAGFPSGLPERGPLAALVNEPAFREIPRIAASDAADDITNNTTPAMSKLIFAALAISAAAENAETEAVQAIDRMKVEAADAKSKLSIVEAENADLKKKVEAAETKAAEADKKRRESIIEAAVTAGKIAPKDEDTKKTYFDLLEANEALGVKTIELLPAKFADLTKSIVKATDKKVDETTLEGHDLLEAALNADAKA